MAILQKSRFFCVANQADKKKRKRGKDGKREGKTKLNTLIPTPKPDQADAREGRPNQPDDRGSTAKPGIAPDKRAGRASIKYG